MVTKETGSIEKDSVVDENKEDDVLEKTKRNHILTYSAVLVLSFIFRLIKVGYSDNGMPVFDEKHYVPQASQMIFNGGLENNPGYGLIVHPPLGKVLMSWGQHLFGYTPVGWRFSSLVAGIVITALIMVIVHKLTKNFVLTTVAGVLSNLDGTIFTMSRTGMLDIFLAAFILLGATFIVFDLYQDNSDTPWCMRWYLMLSGLSFGLAMAVKLSGAYYAAFAGIVLVLHTIPSSRSVRETARATGMGLIYYMVIPVTVFMSSWIPWFKSEFSVYRHAIQSGEVSDVVPDWIMNALPDSLANFVYYQAGVLKFHTSLKTSEGYLHPWESKPTQWLYGNRPMLFLNDKDVGDGNSIQLWLISNMSMWIILVPVFVWGVYQIFFKKNMKKWAVPAGGLFIGLFPWFISYDRQMYFFYMVIVAPFLVMSIGLCIDDISTEISKRSDKINKEPSLFFISIGYTIIALSVFLYFTPWYYGLPASEGFHKSHTIFDSWKPLESKDPDSNTSELSSALEESSSD